MKHDAEGNITKSNKNKGVAETISKSGIAFPSVRHATLKDFEMSDRWVKLWAGQFSHWISDGKPWCDGYLWSYICMTANYKKGIVSFRNEYIEVNRGEKITSLQKLAEKSGWERKKVKKFLNALKNDNMLDYRSTNRYIKLSVLNYDRYQGSQTTEGTTEGTTAPSTEGQQKDDRRTTEAHKQEVKEVNNSKNIYMDFVMLTEKEHTALTDKYGKFIIDKYIDKLNDYIGAIGVKKANTKYKSHNSVINSWIKKDNVKPLPKPQVITKEEIIMSADDREKFSEEIKKLKKNIGKKI